MLSLHHQTKIQSLFILLSLLVSNKFTPIFNFSLIDCKSKTTSQDVDTNFKPLSDNDHDFLFLHLLTRNLCFLSHSLFSISLSLPQQAKLEENGRKLVSEVKFFRGNFVYILKSFALCSWFIVVYIDCYVAWKYVFQKIIFNVYQLVCVTCYNQAVFFSFSFLSILCAT